MVTPVQASASCSAVNSGAFNLTNTTLGASRSAILFGWFVGDQITLTLSSSDGNSRIDGFYHGSTFAAGTFGPLQTAAVPATGNVQITYTVVSSDLTNGIAVDPENNDSVTATCTPAPGPAVTGISPNTGLAGGGTSVIITGMGFVNVSAVSFGPNGASLTVNSTTQITATAPAGSGTVDVTVTTTAGTSPTSSADQYTYIAVPMVTSVSPSVGRTAGGATVTIGGANLNGATAVSFGGVTATINTDSASSITATSPAHSSGTVDVTVTTLGGTSATSAADHFTYFAPPTVTAVSPTSGVTTGGTSVTITGTNLNGATAVSFGGVAATINADAANSITATSPAHSAGIVDVTVTTPGGTSSTSAADQFTYQPPTRTWVSGLGSDSNPCSLTAPCLTFAAALALSAAGGEIDVLDPGDFGPVTITKSISIDGGGGQVASILGSGTSGITISAASTDVIILRNLRFNGLLNAGSPGLSGVSITSAARVVIENCNIFGFATAGIYITPSSGSIQVKLQDVTLNDNHRGIWSQPSGGATVNATFERMHSDQNTGGGILIDGTNGGASTVSIANSSAIANGGNGVNAQSGASGNVAVDISGMNVANNNANGIQVSQASGGAAVVTVGDSTLSYNGSAWSIVGGATLLDFRNNQVTGPIGSTPSQASFQ
jgi:IPT/TIG domain